MQQVVYKPQILFKKTVEPQEPVVSAATLGAWLRMPTGQINAEKEILESNIAVATEIVENYTWLVLRETTFEGYFSHIYPYLVVDTAPILDISSILSISYLQNDTDDWIYASYALGDEHSNGTYENVDISLNHIGYANLTLRNLENIDIVSRVSQYPLKVTYKAGYAYDSENDKYLLPHSLRMAILNLASKYYTDRGDCIGCVTANGYRMPASVKMLLDTYAIQNISLGVDDSSFFVDDSYKNENVV